MIKVVLALCAVLFLSACETTVSKQPDPLDPMAAEVVDQTAAKPVVKEEDTPKEIVKEEKKEIVVQKVVQPCPPAPKLPANLIGQLEYITVSAPNGKDTKIRDKARIDTGAQTTSINAHNIQHFERDGEKWVAFDLKDPNTEKMVSFKRPLVRKTRIKMQNSESVRRKVVKLTLQLGKVSKTVEVTLANRENFKYPILVGRNFLQGNFVVDVSKEYLGQRKATTQ